MREELVLSRCWRDSDPPRDTDRRFTDDEQNDTPIESPEDRDWAFRTRAQRILVEPRRPQLDAFRSGFAESVPCVAAILALFSRAERRYFISGDEAVSARELSMLLHADDSSPESLASCEWIKELVHDDEHCDGDMRRALLRFATGLHAIPCHSSLQIQVIVEPTQGPEYRPSASTCQKSLHLGMYESKEQLQSRLLEALKPENLAFGEFT